MKNRRSLLLVFLPAVVGVVAALLLSTGWVPDPRLNIQLSGDLAGDSSAHPFPPADALCPGAGGRQGLPGRGGRPPHDLLPGLGGHHHLGRAGGLCL